MEKCDSQPRRCEGPQADMPLRPFLYRKDLRMAATERKAQTPRWTTASREAFLARLAETSNVSASARAAGMPVSSVYALRRKSPEFRIAWGHSLAEGYARLEASLLETALKKARGAVDPDELRRDAQKHRLALSLLAQHRPSIKAMLPSRLPTAPKQVKAMIMERVAQMQQRLEAAEAGNASNG